MSNEMVLTDADFDQKVKQAKGLVLVDFFADWCMPCRMLAPTIEKLAAEYSGKVTVGKLDVDKSFNTASQYSVTGIPTIILFKNGEPVERMVGLQPIDALKSVLNRHLMATAAN